MLANTYKFTEEELTPAVRNAFKNIKNSVLIVLSLGLLDDSKPYYLFQVEVNGHANEVLTQHYCDRHIQWAIIVILWIQQSLILPNSKTAQEAELTALCAVLERAQGAVVNIYSNSAYAVDTLHSFAQLQQE